MVHRYYQKVLSNYLVHRYYQKVLCNYLVHRFYQKVLVLCNYLVHRYYQKVLCNYLVHRYGSSLSQITTDMLRLSQSQSQSCSVLFSELSPGTTSGAGNAYSSSASDSSPDFSGDQCLVFCVVFYRSLFVFLSFFFWPFYCVSFDLWLLYSIIVLDRVYIRVVLGTLCSCQLIIYVIRSRGLVKPTTGCFTTD